MAASRRSRATARAAPRLCSLIRAARLDQVTIHTGAGPKHLRLLRREGRQFWFEMNMGSPVFDNREIRCNIPRRPARKK